MYHFVEPSQNQKGDINLNASIKVIDRGTGAVVDIYSDDGGTPIANNIAIPDEDTGYYSFYVDDGTYHVDTYRDSLATDFYYRIEDYPMIGSALELSSPVTSQSGTTYTFDIDDENTVVQFTSATAVTATIPPNSSVAFNVGCFIELHQGSSGTVTIAAGSGVTLESYNNLTDLAGQGAVAGLRKVATDAWRLTGAIA